MEHFISLSIYICYGYHSSVVSDTPIMGFNVIGIADNLGQPTLFNISVVTGTDMDVTIDPGDNTGLIKVSNSM